jgi:RNA polymerase sigma-70 factor, ECF subfamily
MTLFLERRELLARFRAGERRALEETYRHYAPVVASFLSRGFTFKSGERLLRFDGYSSPFDLDNTLAETFVRAFREQARLGYDGLNPYKNYLLTIARNLVIDELRGREVVMSALPNGAAVLDRLEPSEDGGDAQSMEEDLLAKELAGLCARFVDRLADRDRVFFKARFEETKTQVEAGRAAGLSHMQARTLEKKLREKLLKFLHASGYLEGRMEAR